jgi:hypothetical protein
MSTLDRRPHFLKFNGVWLSPGIEGHGAVVRELTRDWQLSGVLTAASGSAYTLGVGYNTAGSNVNITGSPDWGGRAILAGDLGSGCSDNQYGQFNATAVKGPGYGSLGMESGRNYLRGCPDKTVDLSLVRRVRFGKILNETRQLEFRLDVFNALNTVVINGRSTTATFNNPTSMALQNNQYNSDGSLNQSRLLPKNAGFGAATGAQNMRNLQVQVRFQF